MIPILYERDETAFSDNGIARLPDAISCVTTEERNGIYECDFEYPIKGENFDEIKIGRVIGVTHDDKGGVQPFDIVSYTKPINGVVTFHAVHISYRLCYYVASRDEMIAINSVVGVLEYLKQKSTPATPFVFSTDKTDTGWFKLLDGLPRSIREYLGGTEGSVLDIYGGEYEWDRWNVILHSARGEQKGFTVRYGVNMIDFQEEADCQGTYSSCVPYWTGDGGPVVGARVDSYAETPTGRDECVPLDLTDRFEAKPTTAQLRTAAREYMQTNQTYLMGRNIKVEFARLHELGYEGFEPLYRCGLCDSINVVFPDYQTSAAFKIVKTEWDVLRERYQSMELGALSTSLSEAITVSGGGGTSGGGGGVAYTAGTGLKLTGTEFSANLGYTTSGNNRAVLADSNGKLYVNQISGGGGAEYRLTKSGSNVSLTEDGTVVSTVTDDDTKYTAGQNVSISSANVISATDTKYTAGANVAISSANVISATDTTYTAGAGLSLTGTEFSAKTGYTTSGNNRKVQTDANGNLYVVQKDTTYSAGQGLSLSGSTFSVKTGFTTSGNNRAVQADASGNLYVTQKDDDTTYTAGSNVQISSANVISATDTTYSAGSGINIDSNNVISATGGGGGSTYRLTKSGSDINLTEDGSVVSTITDDDTTYSAGSGLSLSGTTFSVKTGYTTSGNNRKVQADSSGNLYVVQKDTTYSAGTYISINSSNKISVSLTKANLLSILGYKETTIEMKDIDGTTTTRTILIKE